MRRYSQDRGRRDYGDDDAGYYGPRDAELYIRRDRDDTRYLRNDCKPITHRVGAGRRARITVETGGASASAFDTARKERRERLLMERERARRETELRREEERRRHRPSPPPPLRHPSARRYHTRPDDEGTSPSPSPDSGAEELEPFPATGDDRPLSEATSVSGVYGAQDDYDFKLPLKPEAVTYDFVEEVSFPLDEGSNESTQKASQASRTKFSGSVDEVSILQSCWLGSVYDRGDLSATISTPGDSAQSEKSREPLIKWFHLERTTMSFEEFIAAAQSILQVPEQKRRDVNRLLRDAQRKYEKQRQHGRDMEPNCISDLFVGDGGSKGTTSMMFAAFPYFVLEPYNAAQLKNLTPGTPMHPLRPLLQAHFHSTSQKRELAQAITKLPSTDEGSCLHLSQIWCLIVDGDTMLTCSRQSHENLCKPAITKLEASDADQQATIKVSFGNGRSWQVPVNEGTTWPGFLSVFGESISSLESDGERADFKINGASVNADEWPFMVGAAQTNSVGIELQQAALQQGRGPLATVTPDFNAMFVGDSLTAATHPAGPFPGPAETPEAVETETAFDGSAALGENGTMAIFKHSQSDIKFLADDLHGVLQSNSREREKKAYKKGAASQLFTIAQWTKANSSSAQAFKSGLTATAFYLFAFFWPYNFDHPLAHKFWGAVEQILQQDSQTYSAARVDVVLRELQDDVAPFMQSLIREFSASSDDLSPLPENYSKAFLHLLMIFVLLSQTSARGSFGVNNSTVRAHMKGLKEELSAGRRAIMERLKTQARIPDLEKLEICSHTSLVALVLIQFSQDVMHGKPDVASTYNDYFYQLDFSITEDPTPRSHQETLRFFLQEAEAILATLQYQLSVLEAFEQSLRQQEQSSDGSGDLNFLLRYALGESRQQIVIDDCKARISARIDKFRGLQQRAEDLGEWHRNEMETNKDRQENAIMIFTIVTIVFLPLSFVSSVFGMNTTDIRDMPYSQWAYWAAGVPLTVLVVVGSLWWAGEFEGFGAWVHRTLSRASSASGGYNRIPEPVSYGQRRGEVETRRMDASYEQCPPPGVRRRTTYPRRTYR